MVNNKCSESLDLGIPIFHVTEIRVIPTSFTFQVELFGRDSLAVRHPADQMNLECTTATKI